MKFKLLAAAALLASSSYANAAVLILDSGWQSDNMDPIGPTDLSPWTFDIATVATLSVTDCCLAGDTWTLSGGVVGITSVQAGAADIRADGTFFGDSWLDPTLGKFSTVLGPGSYSFRLTGDGLGGVPAGVGVRLDSGDLNSAVPEPGTWAMMLLGFGFVGGAMRSAKRRQKLNVSYA